MIASRQDFSVRRIFLPALSVISPHLEQWLQCDNDEDSSMFKMLLRNAARFAPLPTILLAIATPGFSQAPTDAQRAAIRSECRSDYEAHCASVPPGGAASLQCLQKNMSSLSSGCQSAVRAVEPAAAPKAESTPAAAPPTADTAATKPGETMAPATASSAAKKPSSAQIAAVRSACRSDYPKVCAGVPTGGAPALQCLEKNKSKVSAGCETAVSAALGGAAAPAAAGAAAATANPAPGAAPANPPAAALVLRPMRPREELFVLRSACGGDVRTLCGGIPAGGGRIARCLATQAAALSPACREVLGQFAAQ
jgi:hypothetical protein